MDPQPKPKPISSRLKSQYQNQIKKPGIFIRVVFYIAKYWGYRARVASSGSYINCDLFKDRALLQLRKYRLLSLLMLVSTSVHAGCAGIFLYYVRLFVIVRSLDYRLRH